MKLGMRAWGFRYSSQIGESVKPHNQGGSLETSRTLTDCKASHMDRHLRRLSKSIAAWKGGLRIKIFDAAFLVKEVLSIRWQCAGFVWELQGH